MRALIIGASGLVGASVSRVLGRNGAEVTGTTWGSEIPGLRLLDIANGEVVREVFSAVLPEVVVLAENTPDGMDRCECEPGLAEAVNVEGTCHVASAAAACGARLVYYSSDDIFDGMLGPYSEDEPPSPLSVYGKSQWTAEELLRELLPGRHLIIRTTAVYGWNRTSPNFAMFVWAQLQAGKRIRVANDQWCNPTLADYLAEVTAQLIDMGTAGVVNVAGRERATRFDMAVALARTMALDKDLITSVTTAELGQSARHPLQGGLKTEKLRRLLGTEPLTLAESMQRLRRAWRADTHVTHGSAAVSSEALRLKSEINTKVAEYYRLVHAPKAFVPFQSRVNYAGRVFGAEEMVNLVDSALDFWLTLGPWGELFEHKMKKWLGLRDFALVNSGSSANLTAVMALMSAQLPNPLRSGDEVITPAVTFPTTVSPLVHSGMIPVFVDCEAGTYNINPNLIEEAIGPKTRAIMVPHTLGNPCDLDALCDLARRHNLFLVEDACDALGSKFRGRLIGTFGDLSTFSFFPAHHMTMGEGGGVATNDPRLARIVRSVRDWGRDCWCAPGESNTCGRRFGWQLGDLPRGYDHKYIYSNLGYNFKPTEMQAAIGVAQLDRLPEFCDRRRRNFQVLYKGLQEFEDRLLLPRLDPRSDPAWFGLPLTVRDGTSRNELVQFLEAANIETRQIFGGNILKQPAFRDAPSRIHGTLEQTDRVMRDSFFIGVYPGLTNAMLEFVLERFAAFFKVS